MQLLSIEFFVCFFFLFCTYWLLQKHIVWQNRLLLVFSLMGLYLLEPCFLYAVFVYSVFIAVVSTFMEKMLQEKRRYYCLILGIVFTLLFLCFFKYFDFFRPELQQRLGTESVDILFPLGISYYSFQGIAYLVALYKKQTRKLTFSQTLLYFSFFLTVTSGPIARISKSRSYLGEQIGMGEQIQTLTPRQMLSPVLAIYLIILGIAKKWWFSTILADNIVTPVFDNPLQYDGISVLSAIYGYTIQLFLDFSGYTDMVIGLAMLLGFRLPSNFFMPLRAVNLKAFWERWHISLSTWIRDYIYIPLGGNRCSFIKQSRNILIAMILSGVWHGYGWNFFLWGLLHGIGLILFNCIQRFNLNRFLPLNEWWGNALGIFLTFHFVVFTFVIFGSASLEETTLIFSALFHNEWHLPENHLILFLSVMFGILIFYPVLNRFSAFIINAFSRLPVFMLALPMIIVMLIIIIASPSGIPGFIYANF